jgi:hypothetical protein
VELQALREHLVQAVHQVVQVHRGFPELVVHQEIVYLHR